MGLIRRLKCKLNYHEVRVSDIDLMYRKLYGIPVTGQCVHCGKYGLVGVDD